MLDGSVCNVLSGCNATMKCYICGATPKEMNSNKVLEKVPNNDQYRFGLSTLHLWIRIFECLLHISYRLPFKKWQAKGENKEIFENTKKRIQNEFKSKLGLIIDKPKQGYGSSNDGNTARRFFINFKISSEITGINVILIEKFYTILCVLASGREIDSNKFGDLIDETRDLYLRLYDWYYMPSSLHKLLIHGCDIIKYFDIPIGKLSEEVLEARHKEVRKQRLNHTRKSSRVNTNTDLLNMLILTSDPLLASLRNPRDKKSRLINKNVDNYLVHSNVISENLNSSDSDSDTDNSS